MDVTVTQFMRPRGERKTYTVVVNNNCAEAYESMKACGAEITAEVLMSGNAVAYIGHRKVEDDFAVEITPPGDMAAAQSALENMIRGFDADAFKAWCVEALERDKD